MFVAKIWDCACAFELSCVVSLLSLLPFNQHNFASFLKAYDASMYSRDKIKKKLKK